MELEPNLQSPKSPRVPPVGLPELVPIILEENDNIPPNGLYIGVNGHGYLLRAGMLVNVPRSVIDVLNHAIMATPVLDPTTRQVIGYRERTRYPYRRVEVAAA